MVNYSVLFLAVAFIAGSLYGVNTFFHVPNVNMDKSLRRRLLHDPRTVVLKTPDYARSQKAGGQQQSDVQFGSQVQEAEAETAALLVGKQKKGRSTPQQLQSLSSIPQQLQQMGTSSLTEQQQPQQLQEGGASSLMQQQPQQLQTVGSSSMMQQQQAPQQNQEIGASSMMQQQPQQQIQESGASSMMEQQPQQQIQESGAAAMMQQPQQIQEMGMSSMMEQQQPLQIQETSSSSMMHQGSQMADQQQQSQTQPLGSSMLQGEMGQGAQQEQSGTKKNLEFVHITKTGGSAIEAAAAKHNIMWSTCHYWKVSYLGCATPDWEFPKKRLVERMPAGLVYQGEPWHAPPHWNVPNMLERSDTFVVVRNPYERIVSEYYCSAFGYKGDDRENPEVFNKWLSGNLTLLETKLQGHMLPQNYYVYDENGNKVVTHILRYENVQPEFDALMEQYNLPVRMPAKTAKSVFHFKGKNGKKSAETITVNSISPENIERINQIYGRDFEFFGYPMIHVTPSMSVGQGGTLSPETDAGLSTSAGGAMSNMEGSSSTSSSQPQMMAQDGAVAQQPMMDQQGMTRQDSSGSIMSSNIAPQEMMGQNGNGIMSSGGQMRMGQLDAGASHQPEMPLQQQMMSQDAGISMPISGSQQQFMGQSASGMMSNGGQQQEVVEQGGMMMADPVDQQQMMGQDASDMVSSLGQQQGMGLDSSGRMDVTGVLREQPPLGQDGRSMQLPLSGQQQQSMDLVDSGMATPSSQGRTARSQSSSLSLAGLESSSGGASLSSGIDGNRLLKPNPLDANSMTTGSQNGVVQQPPSSSVTPAASNLRKGQ